MNRYYVLGIQTLVYEYSYLREERRTVVKLSRMPNAECPHRPRTASRSSPLPCKLQPKTTARNAQTGGGNGTGTRQESGPQWGVPAGQYNLAKTRIVPTILFTCCIVQRHRERPDAYG